MKTASFLWSRWEQMSCKWLKAGPHMITWHMLVTTLYVFITIVFMPLFEVYTRRFHQTHIVDLLNRWLLGRQTKRSCLSPKAAQEHKGQKNSHSSVIASSVPINPAQLPNSQPLSTGKSQPTKTEVSQSPFSHFFSQRQSWSNSFPVTRPNKYRPNHEPILRIR